MAYTECEGKLKYPKKEEQMNLEVGIEEGRVVGKLGLEGCSDEELSRLGLVRSPEGEYCSEETCCEHDLADESVLFPARVLALASKIQTAHNMLDRVLGSRGVDEACGKAAPHSPIVETSLTLCAAYGEMNELLERLKNFIGWFV